ncbi:MAG: 3-oxoacyl-[acyl-carrier-protein] synthase III C-terminal domain-containing protein [Anaerolineae bacterium]
MQTTSCLLDFQSIRPRYETSQESILEWIALAHAKAESFSLKSSWHEEHPAYLEFYREIKQRLFQIGLGANKIQKRGIELPDIFHRLWQTMQIYNLNVSSHGAGLKERSCFFGKTVDEIFERFYPLETPLPDHLVHVTCTGYVAPSGAQKIVSKRSSGAKTYVTHAYHMGCYASIPAIRIAQSSLHPPSSPLDFRADIVHTELCSLHMNPQLHETEQLIVQSLFGDGFIKYSLLSEDEAKKRGSPYLKILALHEEVIPDSTDSMSWQCEDWGFKMSIAKEVPVLIARHLPSFLKTLMQKAQLDAEKVQANACFAIHPGGPRIIDQIAKILDLKEQQYKESVQILRDCGNMSSATLPHVWEKMLNDRSSQSGQLIASLAFGPGLNISGALFEKRGTALPCG